MKNTDAQQEVVNNLQKADNILVTVAKNPSVDALAAALGITVQLNDMGKRATAVVSGKIPPAINFLHPEKTFKGDVNSLRDFVIALNKDKADHLRYKLDGDVVKVFITPYEDAISKDDLEFSQGDYNVDAILAIGVKNQSELDAALESHGRIMHDVSVSTIGFEKSSLGTTDWNEKDVSSLSEMAASLILGMEKGSVLTDQVASAFLTGIVASTDKFTNDKTNSSAMTMAAKMMSAGANQQLIMSRLSDKPKNTDNDKDKDNSNKSKSFDKKNNDNLKIAHKQKNNKNNQDNNKKNNNNSNNKDSQNKKPDNNSENKPNQNSQKEKSQNDEAKGNNKSDERSDEKNKQGGDFGNDKKNNQQNQIKKSSFAADTDRTQALTEAEKALNDAIAKSGSGNSNNQNKQKPSQDSDNEDSEKDYSNTQKNQSEQKPENKVQQKSESIESKHSSNSDNKPTEKDESLPDVKNTKIDNSNLPPGVTYNPQAATPGSDSSGQKSDNLPNNNSGNNNSNSDSSQFDKKAQDALNVLSQKVKDTDDEQGQNENTNQPQPLTQNPNEQNYTQSANQSAQGILEHKDLQLKPIQDSSQSDSYQNAINNTSDEQLPPIQSEQPQSQNQSQNQNYTQDESNYQNNASGPSQNYQQDGYFNQNESIPNQESQPSGPNFDPFANQSQTQALDNYAHDNVQQEYKNNVRAGGQPSYDQSQQNNNPQSDYNQQPIQQNQPGDFIQPPSMPPVADFSPDNLPMPPQDFNQPLQQFDGQQNQPLGDILPPIDNQNQQKGAPTNQPAPGQFKIPGQQ